MIEQTRFLSTVFSCSEFKFGYLLWSKFLQEKCLRYFIYGNLFLRIAGKNAKIRTRKNFVPLGIRICYKLDKELSTGSVLSYWFKFYFP